MFCKKCGNQINGQEKFCPICGNPIEKEIKKPIEKMQKNNKMEQTEQQETEKPKKKKSKVKRFFVILSVIVLVAGATTGVLYYRWYTSPEQKILRALDKEDYDTAISLYGDDFTGDSKTIDKKLEERIDSIKDDYVNGNLEYSIAKEELEKLEALENSGIEDKLKETIEYIKALNASRTAYNAAEDMYANEDYQGAIENYKKVIEDDSNYKDAQDKIADCIDGYRTAILDEAKALAEEGSYDKAMKKLSDALEILPDDEKIKPKYDEYKKNYIDSVIADADNEVAEGNYATAISNLNAAIQTIGSDDTLEAKLEEVQGSKPVSLSTFTPINGGWDWNTGTPTDSFGTTYNTASNFVIFSKSSGTAEWNGESLYLGDDSLGYEYESYAEYRLYGDYKTLSFDVVPHSDMGEYCYGSVKVYADDNLVFSSADIGRKTDLQSYQIDITNADYIKIVVKDVKPYGDGDTLMLLNCMLSK